jgi:hypothetical protein
VEKYYSEVQDGLLLHMVYRKADFLGRTEVIDPDNFLQLATLKLENDQTFKPHQHIWKDGPEKVKAQESWVVVQGVVQFMMYDIDGSYLGSEFIYPGDASITLHGGHTYKARTKDVLVYEFKTGPYTGQENDKVFI